MSYNATVYRSTADGEHVSTFAAEVNGQGVMLRANSVQCTGLEGTERYDAYIRSVAYAGHVLRIVQDGAQGYKNAIMGLALPASYRQAAQ